MPDGPSQTAVFGAGIMTEGQLAFTNRAVTVNQIQFDNSLTYAIGGLGSVNFAATTADSSVPPAIDVQSGNHQFQAIVNLLDNGTANITSDSTLTFNNALNLNGNTLIKTGEGTMEINNTLNTGGGTVNLHSENAISVEIGWCPLMPIGSLLQCPTDTQCDFLFVATANDLQRCGKTFGCESIG